MRIELKKELGQRMIFTATVEKFGYKDPYRGYLPIETICFKNIIHDNKLMSDHVWFTVGKRIKDLRLEPGEKVSFEARISSYSKGYVNRRKFIYERRIDYKLNNPTKLKRI